MGRLKLASFFTVLFAASSILGACATVEGDHEAEPISEITSATVAECNNVNEFINISDSLAGAVQRRVTMKDDIPGGRVTLTQDAGTIGGNSRGWARISGNLEVGDQLWMDWSTDGTRSFRQCGPFRVNNSVLTSATTSARLTGGSNVRFRACARLAGTSVSVCNDWW